MSCPLFLFGVSEIAAFLKSAPAGILVALNPVPPGAYMQTGPAPVVKVPLPEYQPLTPIEGDWR